MDDTIQPASITQVRQMLNGRTEIIENDVGNVAADLRAIDPQLRLRHSKNTNRFVVFTEDEHGQQRFVTSAPQCDQRLVQRVREITSADYNYVKELEKLDRIAQEEQEYQFSQRIGDYGERLAFALRKDTGRARPHRKIKGVVGH